MEENGIQTKPGNIAFSFYIDTNYCEVKKVEGLTIEIAKIIIEVLEKMYGIKLQIKFPNDIVYKNKKIGGVLTQSKLKGNKVKYIVIGIRIKHKSGKIS